MYRSYYESPFGRITLESDGKNLTVLKLECHRFYDDFQSDCVKEMNDLEVFVEVKEWLDKYFRGERPSFSHIPLAPKGSPFRQMVFQILCEIPYGEVITYGEIAHKISMKTGKKMSGQAVGGAVGHNPISILIPCHRVVGAGGNLTGYGGGIQNKIKLLQLEGVDITPFYVPTKGGAL